jgi:hypothetical protein
MRTSPNLLRGAAAAALLVTVYGIAAGTSGAMPGSHAASGSARPAQADSMFADVRQLAQVKQDIVMKTAEHTRAQQAHADISRLTDLKQLARVKRDIVRETAGRSEGG